MCDWKGDGTYSRKEMSLLEPIMKTESWNMGFKVGWAGDPVHSSVGEWKRETGKMEMELKMEYTNITYCIGGNFHTGCSVKPSERYKQAKISIATL